LAIWREAARQVLPAAVQASMNGNDTIGRSAGCGTQQVLPAALIQRR
jgi:acyl-CoA hydrolase